MIQTFTIEPKYKKENGLWVIDIDRLRLPENFQPIERSLVCIPPQQIGGNHKHPRVEAFLSFAEPLTLAWLDEQQKKYTEVMRELTLYVVSSNLPHAIINSSTSGNGVLLEFADMTQHNVESVEVIT